MELVYPRSMTPVKACRVCGNNIPVPRLEMRPSVLTCRPECAETFKVIGGREARLRYYYRQKAKRAAEAGPAK